MYLFISVVMSLLKMKIVSKGNNFKRSFATAADIFEGIIKSKDTSPKPRSSLPPPSYGGRYIVSMLPGNLHNNKIIDKKGNKLDFGK